MPTSRARGAPSPASTPAHSLFVMLAILTGERGSLLMALVCISLVVSDAVHLSMCLLDHSTILLRGHHTLKEPRDASSRLPPPPHPCLLLQTASSLFLSPWICLYWTFRVNGII